MGNLIKRVVRGNNYYYLEKNVKIGEKKWKKVSIYLGNKIPSKKLLLAKKKELEKKSENAVIDFYNKLLNGFKFYFLSRKELAEIERL